MDMTNVNSGERSGLKQLLANIVPMLVWIGCGNHQLALCFKCLLGRYPCIFETDTFLLSIYISGNFLNTCHAFAARDC